MPLTLIVRYSWQRDGFRIIRPDRLIAGANDVASTGGGSQVVTIGGATCCSSVLSSRNVTRRRVCLVASLRILSACSSLRCALDCVTLSRSGVCTMYERGSAHLVTISPGLHRWVSLLRILTRCPACNMGSSGPARRSWSRIMRSLRCSSCSLVSCWFCCISVG